MGIKRYFALMRRASTVFEKYHESLFKKWRLNNTSLNIFVQEYQCPRKSSSIGNICLGYIKLIPSQ